MLSARRPVAERKRITQELRGLTMMREIAMGRRR